MAARRSTLFTVVVDLFFLGLFVVSSAGHAAAADEPTAGPSVMDVRNQALKLNGAGQLERAIELLQYGTRMYPGDHSLALDLAANYAFARRYEDALPAYQHALQLLEQNKNAKPLEKAQALTWIGVCHRRLGHGDEEAIVWMEKSRETLPENAENLYHLCVSYMSVGRMVEGGRMLAEAMKLESKDVYFARLSQILSALGFWDILKMSLHACLEGKQCRLDSNPYKFHTEYAVSLSKVDRVEESQRQFKIAANLAGKDVSYISQIAKTFVSKAQTDHQASKDIPTDEKSLEHLHEEFSNLLSPLFTKISQTAWSIIQERHILSFRWPIPDDLQNQAIDELKKQKKSFETTREATSVVQSFTCLALPMFTLEDCNFAAAVSSNNLQTRVKQSSVSLLDYHSFRRDEFGAPLHIGLFSADVRAHPMLSLLNAFFKYTFPMPDVRVTLYHANSSDPVYLNKFKPFVDGTKECSKAQWEECVRHARQSKVQLWLETTGHTGEGIPAIAAAGSAPVGVLWAGFPGSLGMTSTLQYIVSDRYTVPMESDIRNAYPEHILYVPGSWMIADRALLKEMANVSEVTRESIREEYSIPVDAFVYGYFGRFWKVDDRLFRHWCEILKRVPNSYLVVLVTRFHQDIDPKYMTENIQTAWLENGLALDRLKILAPFMRGDHIRAMSALCDVALDTTMYGGATTAYESLYAGLPLVHTAGGEKMMQRAGGSILSAASLADELIGKDLDEYVDIAVRLGIDVEYFTNIKRRVADSVEGRNGSVLFQPELGVAALVDGLKHAYHLWRAGENPRDILDDQNRTDAHKTENAGNVPGQSHVDLSGGEL